MSDRLTDLNIVGVIALTRLVYASAYCKQVILDHGALEKAQKIASQGSSCHFRRPLSKGFAYHQHIESVCCALQYLTYERTVAFEGEAWNKIIKRLIGFISNCFSIEDTVAPCFIPGKAGCALGVVGNIVRWGHPTQIKTLTKDAQQICMRLN